MYRLIESTDYPALLARYLQDYDHYSRADPLGDTPLIVPTLPVGNILLQHDLKQDAAREVFARARVTHHERRALHHQRPHVRQRHVGRRLRVIQPAVGIFLDDALAALGVASSASRRRSMGRHGRGGF